MKYLTFAGGHGTRLWPLSRRNTPKQFEKLIDDNSTVQLMYSYLKGMARPTDIYISTNQKFCSIIQEQLPDLDPSHIIGEPERRDLLAAVGYALTVLKKQGAEGPLSITWCDHVVKDTEAFAQTFLRGEKYLRSTDNEIIFVGEKPTYAEQNLGWIKVGDSLTNQSLREFTGWHYRPPLETAKQYFQQGYLWNTGYFITTIEYLWSLIEKHQPATHQILLKIEPLLDNPTANADTIASLYSQIPKDSFDDALVQHIPPEKAAVIETQMGWSDPGTLYAFKDAQVGSGPENYTHGQVVTLDTTDSLIYNSEGDQKIVTTIGLEGFVVVNTKDALLVVHKDDVPRVKELVKKLGDEGWEKWQ